MSSSNSIRRGAWLVYFNGIHVPATSATVTLPAFGVPTASITVAPDSTLLRLGKEDRVQVHIFYLDDIRYRVEGRSAPEYRLLFDGEITGYNYENSPMGRAISFQARNYMAVLEVLKAKHAKNVDDIATAHSKTSIEGAAISYGTQNTMYTGMLQQGITGDGIIKRPYDLVENTMRFLTTTAADISKQRSALAGHFFSRWARRVNFLNRWAPSPFVENQDLTNATDGIFPILKAVTGVSTIDAVQGMAAALGGSTIWSFLTTLMQNCAYEFTLLPNMPLVSYDLKTGLILGPPEYSGGSSALDDARKQLQASQELLSQMQLIQAEKINQVLVTSVSQADSQTGSTVQTAKVLLADGTKAEDVSPEAVLRAQEEFATAVARVDALTTSVLQNSIGRGPADALRPLRILNYVTKPQLQFTAPPRCNIIFPSMVTSYTYGEDYTTQPTRVLLGDEMRATASTGGANASPILTSRYTMSYYPPAIREAINRNTANPAAGLNNFLLWPEEFFRGPNSVDGEIPKFLYMHFQAQLAKGSKGAITDTYMTQLNTLYNIYAEYEYYKIRGLSRTGGVGLCFNPYITPGFPAVIFDQREMNVNIFCHVMQVTHSLSDSGMSTSVGYHTIQPFEEFFSTYRDAFGRRGTRAVTISDTVSNVLTRATDLAASTKAAKASPVRDELIRLLRVARTELAAFGAATGVTEGLAVIDAALNYTALAAAPSPTDVATAESTYNNALTTLTTLRAAAQPLRDYVPTLPIPEIRDRFQAIGPASDYYAKLFYQGAMPEGGAVVDWHRDIGVEAASGAVSAPWFDLTEQGGVTTTASNAVPDTTTGVVPMFVPAGPLEAPSTDTDLAMEYVSRPIVTLDEYIDFLGDRGVRQQPFFDTDPGNTTNTTAGGVRVYAKILDLVQGPGLEPQADANGYPLSVLHADTRENWELRLLEYRRKMLTTLTNFTS